MKADDRLVDVAAAVSDGARVEWQAVESATDPSQLALVRHLRLVERIASVHASLPPVATFERSLQGSLAPHAATTLDRVPGRWGPLVISRRIGSGTYAEVYLARDPRLDRPVALKLLRSRDAADPSDSESIEEARLLARVRHPNVVTVYGAERIDGRTGIWMEYVDGHTLEQELRDRGPFSAAEIVEVGVALCGALGAVHAAGLLHRDVKAQNVMRDRAGRLFLTDFGTGRETVLARSGDLAGTPMYLAPEVLNGATATAASDLYSLGVLLFHVATGSFPIAGRSLPDLNDAHARGARVAVRQARPGLPVALAAAIDRAANADPSARYATAADLRAALLAARSAMPARRRLAIVAAAAFVVVAALAAGARYMIDRPARGSAPLRSPQWLLVAAVDNRTGEPELTDAVDYLLSEALATSHVAYLVAPERIDDTLKLMRRPSAIRVDAALAHELAVRDGGIGEIARSRLRRTSTGYQFTLEVVDADTGRGLTSDTEEAGRAQADLARAVRQSAAAVRRALGDSPADIERDSVALERVTTRSDRAVQLYSEAVRLGNEHQWGGSAELARQAVRDDPQFASAHTWLGWSLLNTAGAYDPGHAEEAREHFARGAALAGSASEPERYFILGSYFQTSGQWEEARRAYESALASNPNDFWATSNLIAVDRQLGRTAELNTWRRHAINIRPNSVATLFALAQSLVIDEGDVSAAQPIAAKALSLAPYDGPSQPLAWLRLFNVHARWVAGYTREAADELDAIAPQVVNPLLLTTWNLTLGRRRAAEAVATSANDVMSQDAAALVAFANGDLTALRARLNAIDEREVLRVSLTGWLLHAAGLDAKLRKLAEVEHRKMAAGLLPPTDENRRSIEMFTALAAHSRAHIDSALQANLAVAPPGSVDYFVTLEALVEQDTTRGRLAELAGTLENSAASRPRTHQIGESTGYFWLRTRARLARIYRELGRDRDAAALDEELRQALSSADSDFSPIAPLRAQRPH